MDEPAALYAEVLLPLPLPGSYTYVVPPELEDSIQVGMRVVVQFGKNKVYTALVKHLHRDVPIGYMPKSVISVTDVAPVITENQLVFWEQLATYYLCTQGEIMNAAVPSALKLASESKIFLHPSYNGDISNLNEKEYLVVLALQNNNELTVNDVSIILEQKKVAPLLKTLIEKEYISMVEELKEKFQQKKEVFIHLSPDYEEDEKLKEIFEILTKKAFKQLKLLMYFIHLRHSEGLTKFSQANLIRQSGCTTAELKQLLKRGVLIAEEEVVSRLDTFGSFASAGEIQLNEYQEVAIDEIRRGMEEKGVVLLHGVTSSGKTELYIKLIEECLKQGRQVLYLLPEIALTTQIISRLQKYFGTRVGVYHSRYNEQERVEIWNHVLEHPFKPGGQASQYSVVLGARSSLFLPFSRLGLIIVDEEHDSSFKQHDPAPRYHARDSAIMLAKLHGAKVVLGSATPSVESYFNALNGKYALVELKQRFGNMLLPEILVVDLKEESRKKKMKSHFSEFLLQHIGEALENQEQVILFQNRRGFSLRLECEHCHWIPGCTNCDVTLTYHKQQRQLRCHYCGFSTGIPVQCPACGGVSLKMKGFGTEKVEEDLAVFFPKARIVRMDLDTTRSRHAYHRIIKGFEEKKIDVLVGTQMVTKGLDFENVSLVGILNADNMLSFPDFRAPERSFQLMTQVSGRAGRKTKRGKVVIQTYNPYHMIIRQVIDNDYTGMYSDQTYDRKNFRYPPYVRLVRITLKHKESNLLNEASRVLAARLRDLLGERVLGPEFPLVSRIQQFYIKQILIKLDKDLNLATMKKEMLKLIGAFEAEAVSKGARVLIDVDPY